MPHIMLSYQWDNQEMVKQVFEQLEGLGFDCWMDIEDMSGNINERMAEAVEGSLVVVPFMTQKYQESRNCKKELNYADALQKDIVPVMAQTDYRATSWLGLVTAGLLWMDFRNPDHLSTSIKSLLKEVSATCGTRMTELALDAATVEARTLTAPQKGRAFRHISSGKFLAETGEVITHWGSGSRSTLTCIDEAEDTSFWEQVSGEKGSGLVLFRNFSTKGYLGYDPNGDYIYTKPDHYRAEDWKLITDDSDDTGKRAVVIFADYGKTYLTVRDGNLTGVDEGRFDAKVDRWYLD